MNLLNKGINLLKIVNNYVPVIRVCSLNLQRKLNLTLLAMKMRANLQCIQSLTYVINDENVDLLQDMNSQLQHLYDTVYQQLPNKEGLHCMPTIAFG